MLQLCRSAIPLVAISFGTIVLALPLSMTNGFSPHIGTIDLSSINDTNTGNGTSTLNSSQIGMVSNTNDTNTGNGTSTLNGVLPQIVMVDLLNTNDSNTGNGTSTLNGVLPQIGTVDLSNTNDTNAWNGALSWEIPTPQSQQTLQGPSVSSG